MDTKAKDAVQFATCKSHRKTACRFHQVAEHRGPAIQNDFVLLFSVQLFRSISTFDYKLGYWSSGIFCKIMNKDPIFHCKEQKEEMKKNTWDQNLYLGIDIKSPTSILETTP